MASPSRGPRLPETFPSDSSDKRENRDMADADGNNFISSFTLIMS